MITVEYPCIIQTSVALASCQKAGWALNCIFEDTFFFFFYVTATGFKTQAKKYFRVRRLDGQRRQPWMSVWIWFFVRVLLN